MTTLAALWGWTPWLAGGFAMNLAIAALAMALGTLAGAGLGALRDRGPAPLAAAAGGAASVCRNVPSFVLMLYLAFLLPVEIERGGSVVAVPLWLKAALALTIPVTGFASDQTRAWRAQREAGLPGAGETLLTAGLQYFLIALMASSTASVIGADEIVSRANRVIATDGRPAFLIATYLWVALLFLAAGLLVSAATPRLARRAAALPPVLRARARPSPPAVPAGRRRW
jgi:ABC-type amino acid transport system permease subunit